MTSQYEIKGMTCGHCIEKVKKEILAIEHVANAQVRLDYPQLTIFSHQPIAVSSLMKAVHKAGPYKIRKIQEEEIIGEPESKEKNSYFPVFLIFAFITGVTLLLQFSNGSFNTMEWMSQFMAAFFLLFSFFKFLDLKGFSGTYRRYDIIAARFPVWAWIYPFVELGLGILFLLNIAPMTTALLTIIIMGLGSIGVIASMARKQRIQCACLGTIIKVPVGKLTLIEDLLMVGMSIIAVIMIY